MRAISDEDGRKLKAATRRAVKAAGGGDALSLTTRVSEGQLSKYGLASEDHQDTYIPLDVALEADREAGSPIIAAALAAAQGFRLVPEDAEDPAQGLDYRDVTTVGVAFSSFQSRMHEALSDDGKVDEGERRAILRDFDRLMRALFQIMGRV
ncbi:hypothetical protein [Martelella endophytica]|uniref:Uncharacterized protein n=1 Tax=Martelella endophytica TaxID=1486262 RepID=A0A0D5LKF9_MAREN|nr:hypothetical protein [Martelella endophytica]AJY44684.1 hypothetical protein TM49_01685 [Martelella endophytica]